MSYRVCIFGVPTEAATQEELLASIQAGIHEQAALAKRSRRPREPGDHFVQFAPREQAEAWGIRFFLLTYRGRSGLMVNRWILDGMPLAGTASLVKLVHDDRRGLYVFETRTPPAKRHTWLLSDGPYLGGTRTRFDVHYPQQGWSNEELAALNRKAETELSEPERRAVMEYHNAVRIGLDAFHPRVEGTGYLDVCHADVVYPCYVSGGDTPPAGPLPRPEGLLDLVPGEPAPEDWKRAKMRRR